MKDKPLVGYGVFVLAGSLISFFSHAATPLQVGFMIGISVAMIGYGVAHGE